MRGSQEAEIMSSILSRFMASARSLRAKNGAIAFLTYHRVGELPYDPQHLSITSQEFEAHLELFKSHYELLTAGEAFTLIRDKLPIPRNGLVLTFDDGYADMADTIHPILEKYQVPATFFISTDSSRFFWWDEVALYSQNPADLFNWNVEQPSQTVAQREYLEHSAVIDSLGASDRQSYLDTLRAEFTPAGESSPATAEPPLIDLTQSYRSLTPRDVILQQIQRLTPQEVVAIDKVGLVEIGAHTASHSRLSVSSYDEQREQIGSSKLYLEELLGHEVRSFSYPYGTKNSFTPATRLFVKQAGFYGACTTMLSTDITNLPWGALYAGESENTLFMTPRIATVNKSPNELIAAIDKVLAL